MRDRLTFVCRDVPERLDHFMARANAAYYANRDPFADFTTAPEISQVFGEILGLWSAVSWELLGRPDPVLLVEAGPGRGSLMADALRAIAHAAPRFRAALSVHLIETSERLRAIQRTAVPHAIWHASIGTLPEQPILLLANEFLDALPVRQFVRRGQGWAERHVQEGQWQELPYPCARFDEAYAQRDGDIVEVREPALTLSAALGDMLSSRPGVALFLDYGAIARTSGDSLQAIRNGRPTNPLVDPGTADLTAHVDFAAFAAAARGAGAATHGPIPQGVFLTRLGLFQRTDRLARNQPPGRVLALIDAARRLAEPDRMGRLFKALALCHPGCPTLPGFES